MDKHQLELYHKNFLAFANGIQHAGGNVEGVLRNQQAFLEMLARNGIEVNVSVTRKPLNY